MSVQLGLDPGTGVFAGEDFVSQTRQALANLGTILSAARCGIPDIVSVDVFMTDMTNFQLFNGIYAEFMRGYTPARVAIELTGLPLGGLVEIRCVAVAT